MRPSQQQCQLSTNSIPKTAGKASPIGRQQQKQLADIVYFADIMDMSNEGPHCVRNVLCIRRQAVFKRAFTTQHHMERSNVSMCLVKLLVRFEGGCTHDVTSAGTRCMSTYKRCLQTWASTNGYDAVILGCGACTHSRHGQTGATISGTGSHHV